MLAADFEESDWLIDIIVIGDATCRHVALLLHRFYSRLMFGRILAQHVVTPIDSVFTYIRTPRQPVSDRTGAALHELSPDPAYLRYRLSNR